VNGSVVIEFQVNLSIVIPVSNADATHHGGLDAVMREIHFVRDLQKPANGLDGFR
jgi:hypothetical protein